MYFKGNIKGRNNVMNGHYKDRILLPCSQCIGCRLERSRQWGIRCLLEALPHGHNNSFITLTFSQPHLYGEIPVDGVKRTNNSLKVRDFQLFMKRLRNAFPNQQIRFFQAGEYGESQRPHYHACLFGFRFPDEKLLYKSEAGFNINTSQILTTLKNPNKKFNYETNPIVGGLWKYGMSTIGRVSFQSSAYVARYCLKKVTGNRKKLHYICKRTKEPIIPEYSTMSRRTGIGYQHYKTNDIYPKDWIAIPSSDNNFVKVKPPKYYDELLRKDDLEMFEQVKKARIDKIDQLSYKRLFAREYKQTQKLEKLIRSLHA